MLEFAKKNELIGVTRLKIGLNMNLSAVMKNKKNWLLMAFIMLVGCAHLKDQKKYEHLEAKQKTFMKALRWKSYETAASMIRFKNPSRRLGDINYLDKVTVTSYELITSVPDIEKGEAIAYVIFEYTQNETGRFLTLKYTQNWWFDEESRQWFLASDMPDFKTE